ncbi:hypothetical protein NSK_002116 [Nannochloropsis salina CCMP1776]|jgi:hypothetical protein|uniref:Peroxisome membrane anchor protein Pex14p N-terminal domain-containing protein n=1 Tax=Nannochloropsis salina CCMP1776 TaxID=1027361 RepID=A0A4D9DD27_9STRA|nr:hypothetical protein NSK_002116 [Nannochloropsis salina CCMP1776]|eukprot:TFJ86459.1 hypothetical protein NSK_002116 [Nannochloropsis salina CCMP1776]
MTERHTGSSEKKDLSRAVAFLTLERVQGTSDKLKTDFLLGKGFTADEIADAMLQARDVIEKRNKSAARMNSVGGNQTFGAAAPTPMSSIAHVLPEPNAKASSLVTLRGGALSFVALGSKAYDGSTSPSFIVENLLKDLERTLVAPVPADGGRRDIARDKADVAVICLSVYGLQDCENDIHAILDKWVDPQAPPARFVVSAPTEKRHAAQLLAIVRG